MKLTKKFYLIIPIVICGITLTAVYATGTVETFTAPWQLQDSSNSQTRMYVDNSGNVGIGTASPQQKLHVSGNSLFGDATANTTQVRIAGGTNIGDYRGIAFTDVTGSTIYSAIRFVNDAPSDSSIRFLTWNGISGGTERMVIKGAGGNVGIGTANPSYTLDVSGQIHTGGSSPKIVLDNGGDVAWPNGASGHGIDFGFGSTIMRQAADGHVKYTSQNGVHEFTGNVGIGTANPVQKLEVNGGIQADGNLTTSSTNKEFKITAPSGVPICIGTGC